MEDLAALRAAINAKTLRTDFNDQIPQFVEWVENDIEENHNRIRPLHVVEELVLTSATIPLPDNLLEIETLAVPGKHELNRVGFEELYRTEAYETPRVYSEAAGIIHLPSAPTTNIRAKLTYWKKLQPIVKDTDFNAILRDHSQIYFQGVLHHFYDWVVKEDESAKSLAIYRGKLESLSMSENHKRQSGPRRPSFQSFS